jgi:predicted nucleic acid-binding protein
MIVVDTSVWIDYFRSKAGAAVDHLHSLLDADEVAMPAPVRIELVSGVRRGEIARLKRVLSALPLWLPTEVTWSTMEIWAERAGARGQRFGMGDLLVAAITAERGAAVWSLDADFGRMTRLGFVRLHVADLR